MAASASPSTSIERVIIGRSNRSMSTSTRARSASDRWSSGAFIAPRNTSRRRTTSCCAEQARVPARVHAVGHGHEHTTGVAVGEPFDDVVDRHLALRDAAGGDHLLERRHRVAGRPASGAHGEVDRVGGNVELGVVDDVAEVVLERRRGKQVELEVLRAAANRLDHLLGIGRGEHEHHAGRRLFERLQQRRRRRVDSMWTSSRM